MLSERDNKAIPAQWLHLLNSTSIQLKMEKSANLKMILDPTRKPPAIIEDLYLTILSRFPTPDEVTTIAAYGLAQPAKPVAGKPPAPPTVIKRREDWQDIAWSLINSTEFLYLH